MYSLDKQIEIISIYKGGSNEGRKHITHKLLAEITELEFKGKRWDWLANINGRKTHTYSSDKNFKTVHVVVSV